MTSMEIARKLAALNQQEEARDAYTLALGQEGLEPAEELEAASYIFFSEGDYRISFTHFVSLFNRGLFQGEIWDLMTQAFYLPNAEGMKKQYEKNVKLLTAYPYCFRKDFPAFEDLPILFFPFDDKGYVPFYPAEHRFGGYVNFNDTVIDRYFFRDLSKPILADDVYSQYQLEYLNDNVRKSEWVAKENHIYLHYSDFATFCAHLQVLNFYYLLKDEKLVFLMEKEVGRYPIDFHAEYGVDYSQYPLKPVGVGEITRLIWHTQLSSHNGGDFFNEILYGHPNLLTWDSVTLDKLMEVIEDNRKALLSGNKNATVYKAFRGREKPTDKNILVWSFLQSKGAGGKLDPESRIAPALLLQPHFLNLRYSLTLDRKANGCRVESEQYDELANSSVFREFKYIKTFTPMRRPTSSYGATARFQVNAERNQDKVICDELTDRLLNRSFMVDPWDRLYRDSRLVRFEDGKLNPTATFTALAQFLDIPYTESMTYCSGITGLNPESMKGNDLGFSTAAIYRTYDEYCDDADRALVEYFYRDVYQTYGYDFHYYQGEPVDEAWVRKKLDEMHVLDGNIKKSLYASVKRMDLDIKFAADTDENKDKDPRAPVEKAIWNDLYTKMRNNRLHAAKILLYNFPFVNKEGQYLQMMTPLELDPALLEQPLYH